MPRNELQTKLFNTIEDTVELDIFDLAYQELQEVFDYEDEHEEECDFHEAVVEILDDFKEVIRLYTKIMCIADNEK